MRSASTDPTSPEPTSPEPACTDPTRAEPASSHAEPAPRRPRITHLVLVDGLPADHWVEESADVRLSPVRSRPGVGTTRRVAALTSETEQRDLELSWLDAVVGGRAALLTLDARPLLPRPLEVPDLGPEPAARARLIGAECDRLAVEVFADEELALVLRRLWEAVLAADPGMLARSTRDDTAVGALVWAAAQANGLLGAGGSLLVRELWSRLGVPASSGSRGAALLDRLAPDAGSLVTPPGAPRLRPTGRSDLLLAATRAKLVTRRDRWLR